MKHDPNSADLEDLKGLLAKSFDGAEGDDVPPLPESLRDRIADQYGRCSSPAPQAGSQGFFSWLTSLFAQPAFAGAAAALVLVITAAVLLNKPNDGNTYRGGEGNTGASVTLVLFQVDEANAERIRTADLFDEKAVRIVTSAAELDAISPPRIVINGSTGTIQAFAEGSDAPIEAALPTNSQDLADTVAELLGKMR